MPTKPLLQKLNGILAPSMFSKRCYLEAMEYLPVNDDIIISTYPKCGTTWMQSMVIHILRNGKELDGASQFNMISPFIDMVGKEGLMKVTRPFLIKTHLPFTHIRYNEEAKYIIVVRNPWDVCISLYHHMKGIPGFGYNGDLDNFFELFMTGEVEIGDYFDHLLSWYPHWKDKNVFFTTYEDIQKDRRSVIFKLAEFLGKEYAHTVETDNKVLANILQFSSFDYMKELLRKANAAEYSDDVLNDPNTCEGVKYAIKYTKSLQEKSVLSADFNFVRSGTVGEGKKHLNQQQVLRLKEKFMEKTRGTDIGNLWNDVPGI